MKTGCRFGWRGAAALLSGAMLAASFPPFDCPQAAWVALAPLLVIARHSRPRVAFRGGFLAGFTFWAVTLAWLQALAHFGSPYLMVAGAWLALAAACALYLGLFTALVALLWRHEDAPGAPADDGMLRNAGRVLLIPILWVGVEYLRSTLFSGFGWNALGVSQYRNLAVIQVAEWGGVYAVSALVVMVTSGLTLTVMDLLPGPRRRGARRLHPELMLALMTLAGAMSWGLARVQALRAEDAAEGGVVVQCATVQANIPQDEKWSDEVAQAVADRLVELSERAHAGVADLVIWPETASPTGLGAAMDTPAYLVELAMRVGPLLVGAMEVEAAGDDYRYYNSALLFLRNGEIAGTYRKQHLVPFGEYVPLADIIPGLNNFAPLGYNCTPGRDPGIFRLAQPEVAFAVLICFEDGIAPLARRAVRAGARLLINQTNDAWFEGTSAGVQHLSQSVFRSVENRVPLVRCANLGVSGIIDRTGALDPQTQDLLERGDGDSATYRLDGVRVPPEGQPLTLYARHGDWAFAIPCACVVAAAILLWWRQARRARAA